MVKESILVHNTISNEPKEIKDHTVQLKASLKFITRNAVVGMEDKGIYGNHLIKKLKTLKIHTVVDSPFRIKNSLGISGTKTDKKDAERIVLYLYKSRDILRLWISKRPIVEQLTGLSTLRKRLQSLNIAMRVPLKENAGFVKKGLIEQNNRLCSRSIDALRLDIQAKGRKLEQKEKLEKFYLKSR